MRLARRVLMMARTRFMVRSWLRLAVLALVVLLPGAGSAYVFDRDGDGVDDGGLDLGPPAAFQGSVLSLLGLLLVGRALWNEELLTRVSSRPRSPPSLLLRVPLTVV